MDFTNATIKYKDGSDGDTKICIKVTYPAVNGAIKSLSVPLDSENTDYQEIMKWVAEGNVIEEAD